MLRSARTPQMSGQLNAPLGVILAGGRSERFGNSKETEKPLAMIRSKPMVLHAARALGMAGVRRIVILTGDNHQSILQGLNLESEFGVLTEAGRKPVDLEVRFSGSSTGTGGRLLALDAEELSASALISYTDVFTDAPLQGLLNQLWDTQSVISMLAVNPKEPWGAMELQGKRVTAFHEKRINPDAWINGGIFAVSPEIQTFIEHQSEMLENEPMERMLASSRVVAEKFKGWWTAVDTPKDLRAINQSDRSVSHFSSGLAVNAPVGKGAHGDRGVAING